MGSIAPSSKLSSVHSPYSTKQVKVSHPKIYEATTVRSQLNVDHSSSLSITGLYYNLRGDNST